VSGDEDPAGTAANPVRGDPNGSGAREDDPASGNPNVLGAGPAIVAFRPDVLGPGRSTDGSDMDGRRRSHANDCVCHGGLGYEREHRNGDETENCPQWNLTPRSDG